MNRSTSVTISAVFMLVGSLFALGSAATLLATAFLPLSSAGQPRPFGESFLVFVSVMYLVVAAWGAATAVGLFRLRRWARVSILVFAGPLILWAGGGVVSTLFAPQPGQSVSHSFLHPLWAALGVVYFLLLVLGVWWLYLFNTAAAKKEFLGEAPQ